MFRMHGRDAELKILAQAWEDSCQGQVRYVRIAGEPGSGKTKLIQAFYELLTRDFDPQGKGSSEGYWPNLLKAKDVLDTIIPEFQTNPKQSIPYLWLALPCRKDNEYNPNSFAPYRKALEQLYYHLASWYNIKCANTEKTDLVVSIATRLLSILPGFHVIETAQEICESIGEYKQKQSERSPNRNRVIQKLEERDSREQEEWLFECFKAINDVEDPSTPTIPSVILIDDAQWADAASIAFTQDILVTAAERNWKLLIISTIRSNELKEQQDKHTRSSQRPITNAAELESGLIRKTSPCSVIKIELEPKVSKKAANLILRDHLGTVTHSTIEALLERAGYQPYFLVNYAKLIIESEWLDQETGDLTVDASELAALPESIIELIDERLRRIERHSSDRYQVLQWGSVQGVRFIGDFIQSVANSFGDLKPAAAYSALGNLRDVHELIGDVPPPPAELDRYEFQHKLIYERIQAVVSKEVYKVVEDCLYESLKQLLEEGRFIEFKSEERLEHYLRLAYLARKRREIEVEFRAILGGNELLHIHHRLTEALQLSKRAAQLVNEDSAFLSLVPFRQLDYLLSTLQNFRELQLAEVFGEEMLLFATDQFLQDQQAANIQNLAISLESQGDTYRIKGKSAQAMKCFKEALKYRELLSEENSLALESKRGIILPLARLGDLYRDNGKLDNAVELYNRAIDSIEKSLTQYGEEQELLRDKYIFHERIGGVLLEKEEYDSALKQYQIALDITEDILKRERESPDSLRSVSIAYSRMADVHDAKSEIEAALSYRQKALSIRQRILSDYGRTPVSIRDIHVSLTRLGSISLSLGKNEEALEEFNEALKLCREIVANYEVTAEAKDDLARVLMFKGWVLLLLKSWDESVVASTESYSLSKETLCYFNISHGKWLRGDQDSIQHYRQGLGKQKELPQEVISDLQVFVEAGLVSKSQVEELIATI